MSKIYQDYKKACEKAKLDRFAVHALVEKREAMMIAKKGIDEAIDKALDKFQETKRERDALGQRYVIELKQEEGDFSW